MIRQVGPPSTRPAGEPGIDYISWSQLSTFRSCPLRYRFRYLDRLEPEFVASSLLVGSSIHAAIELFHRRQLEAEQPPTLDELMTEFREEWKCRVEESPEVRFGRHEDYSSIEDLAGRMLSTFLESDFAVPRGVVIGIEESLRSEILPGRPEFLGIVDLAFVDGESLVIRDYKTSRSKWNQGTAENSADQLLLYCEIARMLLPEHKVRLEFAVLTKTKSPVAELFSVDPDPKRVQRTRRVADRTLDAIATGIFYPNPSAFNCSSCPYRSACSAWKG